MDGVASVPTGRCIYSDINRGFGGSNERRAHNGLTPRLCPSRPGAPLAWPYLPASWAASALGWCKAHATRLPAPDDHRSSLQRKAYGPRGSTEGTALCEQGRANMLSGVSRVARAAAPPSAYRYAAPGRHGAQAQPGGAVDGTPCGTEGERRFQGWSEDGARLLYTGVDNGARLLYICGDTCRHADTAAGVRGHVTHPDHDRTDCLSVAEEATMIDLAAYVLEPLWQDGACLLSRGQPAPAGRRVPPVPRQRGAGVPGWSPRSWSWPRSGTTPPRPASSGSSTNTP